MIYEQNPHQNAPRKPRKKLVFVIKSKILFTRRIIFYVYLNVIAQNLVLSGVFHHTSCRAQLQGTRKSWLWSTSPVAQNIKIEALAIDRFLDAERISCCSKGVSIRTSRLDALWKAKRKERCENFHLLLYLNSDDAPNLDQNWWERNSWKNRKFLWKLASYQEVSRRK